MIECLRGISKNIFLRAIIFFLTLSAVSEHAVAQDSLKISGGHEPAATDSLKSKTAQGDTIRLKFLPPPPINFDSLRKIHSPRKAGFYSAVLPGLGQAYNRQYWKMPLMYAGIGTATGVFLFNFKQYIIYRDAYRLMLQGKPTGIRIIDQNYYQPADVKFVRDAYRQYVDYSALGFLGVYLYNVIDAVVFAHLYKFDMSNDLGFRFGPVLHPENAYTGFGFTYFFHKKKSKLSLQNLSLNDKY